MFQSLGVTLGGGRGCQAVFLMIKVGNHNGLDSTRFMPIWPQQLFFGKKIGYKIGIKNWFSCLPCERTRRTVVDLSRSNGPDIRWKLFHKCAHCSRNYVSKKSERGLGRANLFSELLSPLSVCRKTDFRAAQGLQRAMAISYFASALF